MEPGTLYSGGHDDQWAFLLLLTVLIFALVLFFFGIYIVASSVHQIVSANPPHGFPYSLFQRF